jgi:hypothetical protein
MDKLDSELQKGFLHVPRTAGGSIVNELMKTNWIILGHDLTSPHYMHLSAFRKVHPLKSTFFIGASRNPFDRLVSAYHFLKAGGENESDQADAKKYIDPYSTFEEFVLKSFSWLKTSRTFKQIHLKPQTYWLYKGNNLLIDRLFKYEELNQLFDFIVTNSEIELEMIKHVHASSHSNYKDYYSKNMIKLVERAYSSDLKLLNYSF